MAKSANSNLHRAAKVKNDEFYTRLADIEKELKHYKDQFKNKVVYCNCDDPFESNFFKYFAANFNALGLKRLIATSYKPSPIANTQLGLFGGEENLTKLKGRPKVTANKLIINEVKDVDGDGAFDLHDIDIQLQNHTYADENYYIVASTVLNLAKNALNLFESSDIKEKREILNYLLQNCVANGKNLEYTLRSPYNHILSFSKLPTLLDIVRDIGTFWKTNKEHIWLPNIKQGFFGITRPTEKEMAEYR